MRNDYFDILLQIYTFKDITSQLLDNNLITEREATKIRKRIDKMETDLVAAENAADTHDREVLAA